MKLSDARLAELEALTKATRPSPWEAQTWSERYHPDSMVGRVVDAERDSVSDDDGVYGIFVAADAEFIAAARNGIAALLAEVRSSRVKPVLTTQAEVDALPIGSIVRDGEGDHVAEKVHGGDDTGWHCTDGCWFGGEELLPATVLDTPVGIT